MKASNNIKITCCYCSKNFTTQNIEEHVNKCKTNIEERLLEKYEIPLIYVDIFEHIKNGDYNHIIKEKAMENFNKQALQIYDKIYLNVKIFENFSIYDEKFKKSFENFQDQKYIVLKDYLEQLEKIYQNNSYLMFRLKKEKFFNQFNLICFVCFDQIQFSKFSIHFHSCSNQKIINEYFNVPNINILLEIFKELKTGISLSNFNECNLCFLIKKYNRISIDIIKNKTGKGFEEVSQELAKKKLGIVESKKIEKENILKEEISDFNIEVNCKEQEKILFNSSGNFFLICYICGSMIQINEIKHHIINCKQTAYSNSKIKNIPDPEILNKVLKKYKENNLDLKLIEEYNDNIVRIKDKGKDYNFDHFSIKSKEEETYSESKFLQNLKKKANILNMKIKEKEKNFK